LQAKIQWQVKMYHRVQNKDEQDANGKGTISFFMDGHWVSFILTDKLYAQ
jgi:hypothetical protein